MESSKMSPGPPAHSVEVEEEDENVKQLRDCAQLYLNLQECLVRTNRDWRACQADVKLLKACHERKSLR
ncbi:uncharacterized protein LOC131028869 isoform X1 [Cryptomeria japonica]|uniref:uncharacterized protein LOC131028869 isoform X1 n=1 Tax=Cryptomeria japonica TaxID=3369 RepID=UPI0025AB5D9C|nr:uncharacterized protein LOC131028869 isoform X1 [Cryptomeria japonica]